jgi:hypothetical protein
MTAQNDWEDAAKAGEAGVSVWGQDEDKELSEEEAVVSNDPAVSSRDFGSATGDRSTTRTTEPLLLPSGSFHPPHIDSKPLRSALTRAKRLENVIRLRMTLNVIAEKTLGAETAMLRQQELFAFFSGRSGRNRFSGAGGYSKGLTGSGSFSSITNQEKGLGGSYISVDIPTVTAPESHADRLVAGELKSRLRSCPSANGISCAAAHPERRTDATQHGGAGGLGSRNSWPFDTLVACGQCRD